MTNLVVGATCFVFWLIAAGRGSLDLSMAFFAAANLGLWCLWGRQS